MNLLLLLFAIPFATIIFSIILQKLINNPILVAFATFSVFILLAVTTNDETYYIFTILYSTISYIAALITRILDSIKNRCINNQNNEIENIISNDLNNNTCDKSDIIIEKNNMNRRYWR
ncbi:MAG: DUF2651 family protein [Clostridia bacterium]|nr:DUF2651 family protein [Clostridia bacterium]